MSNEVLAAAARMINLDGLEARLSEALGDASRRQIAEMLEVPYATLSNWLIGRTDLPGKEIAKIATLTDHSIGWILTGMGRKVYDPSADDALRAIISDIIRDQLERIIEEKVKELTSPQRSVLPLDLRKDRKTHKAG